MPDEPDADPLLFRLWSAVRPEAAWLLLALITGEIALSLTRGFQWASFLMANIGILGYAVGFAFHYSAGHGCGPGWFLRKNHPRCAGELLRRSLNAVGVFDSAGAIPAMVVQRFRRSA